MPNPPGGKPGPNADGDWIGLILMFVLAAGIGAAFFYVIRFAMNMFG